MNTETAVTTKSPNLPVKQFFERPEVMGKFKELLGKRAPQFVTSVLQIANSNALLKNADPMSIFNAAATAATMDLPLNNNLGFAYIVPYNEKVKGVGGKPDTYRTVAQFQMGYKGFIQLAQRSGQFRTISASPIYEGQILEHNPLTGIVFDFNNKLSEKVIGYAAYFQLLNGFEKTLYMPIETVKLHGKKYSQTFKKDFGLWKDDFDAMALKTVLKLLLSKYAPLSIEMQRAVITDQAAVNDSETVEVQYVDNQEPTQEEVIDQSKEKVIEKKKDLKAKVSNPGVQAEMEMP